MTVQQQSEEDYFAQSDARAVDTRSARYVVLTNGVLLGFIALGAIPGVAHALGVDLSALVLCIGSMMLANLVGTLVLRGFGPTSRAFRAAHLMEFSVLYGAPLLLVYSSGEALSHFWLWSLGITVINARLLTWARIHRPLIALYPTLLTMSFWAAGARPAAIATLMIGGVIYATYEILHAQSRGHAALQLERQRMLRDKAERDRLEEIHRISRDLHDGLGASLTSLLLRARELSTRAGEEPMRDGLSELAKISAESLNELREVVAGIRDPVTSWEQLVTQLVERASRLCIGRVELRVVEHLDPAAPPPPARVAVELPRFVLEAVRNAKTHAGCKTVHLRFEVGPLGWCVEIEDDGQGLAPEDLASSAGGLKHLEERARLLEARLSFDEATPGTRVSLRRVTGTAATT